MYEMFHDTYVEQLLYVDNKSFYITDEYYFSDTIESTFIKEKMGQKKKGEYLRFNKLNMTMKVIEINNDSMILQADNGTQTIWVAEKPIYKNLKEIYVTNKQYHISCRRKCQ